MFNSASVEVVCMYVWEVWRRPLNLERTFHEKGYFVDLLLLAISVCDNK